MIIRHGTSRPTRPRRNISHPQKRFDKTIVSFLEADEVDVLLAAPDLSRWEGRRDHALLVLAVQTALRLSELTGIDCGQIELGNGAHVRCRRTGSQTALRPTDSHDNGNPAGLATRTTRTARRSSLPHPTGRRLSHDAVEARITTHQTVAGADDVLGNHRLAHRIAGAGWGSAAAGCGRRSLSG